MPRDSNGNYSLPAGYLATTGQTILASQHNPSLEDLAAAITGSLPRNGSAPMLASLPFGGFKGVNMAPGTAATDAVNKSQLDGAMPIGAVIDFAGATAPARWLLCYGQAVSRTTEVALFAVIGTTFGAGDGSTTFNVPDLRGRVRAGKDNMGGTDATRLGAFFGGVARTIGGVLGAASHALGISEMPSHNHGGLSGLDGGHSHGYTDQGVSSGSAIQSGNVLGAVNTSRTTDTAPDHRHTISSQGSGAAHTNAQPTMIFNAIIRAS